MGLKDRTPSVLTSNNTIINSNNKKKAMVSDGYFLECRKDAQCDCNMCKASIHATLDLRPSSSGTLVSSLTNRLASAPSSQASDKENRPSPYPPSSRRAAHDKLSLRPGPQPTPLRPRTALFLQLLSLGLLLGLCLPRVASFFWESKLSGQDFAQLARASMARRRLLDKLDFVQHQVSRMDKQSYVSNCTGPGSRWRLSEEGHFLHSSCNLYGTPMEKVSVWGYTAKTAGILGRSMVERTFMVLCGRVIEWREGQIEHVVHTEGSTWTMPSWTASAILLDGNTWLLEYSKTPLSQGFSGVFHGFLHLAKTGLARIFSDLRVIFDTAFFVKVQSMYALSKPPPT